MKTQGKKTQKLKTKAVAGQKSDKKAAAKKPTVSAKASTKPIAPKKPQAKTTPSDLIGKYRRGAKDTGSTEVQIAVLSERIRDLAGHLKKHSKDFDSRRGLLLLVSKRRRLLNYLKRTDESQYHKMVADLKLLQ